MKKKTTNGLEQIPGVGPSIAEDLRQLGYTTVESLKHQDPEAMYESLCRKQGITLDRCLLYVFRCAVYYATNSHHDPELLKWWHWKNRTS